MEKEIVEIPKLSEALRKIGVPLSPCVRAGGFLYISGLPPLDLDSGQMVKGGIDVQTEQVMQVMKHTLESAGSSLDRVVKCQVFVTNSAYYRIVNEIYGRYFPHDPPAQDLRRHGVLADGVRHRDRVRRARLSARIRVRARLSARIRVRARLSARIRVRARLSARIGRRARLSAWA